MYLGKAGAYSEAERADVQKRTLGCVIPKHILHLYIVYDYYRGHSFPEDDEHFQEFHSHVYGPVGIFLMDLRGNRITGNSDSA